VYRSTDGAVTWTKITSGPIASFSNYNAVMEQIPDNAGDLVFTVGPQGGTNDELDPPSSNTVYRANNCNTGSTCSWSTIPNVREVFDISFGKSATTGGYPVAYIIGYVDDGGGYDFGIWRSTDFNNATPTWTLLTDAPMGWLDRPRTIEASPDVYGRVYVGFAGSSSVYGEPEPPQGVPTFFDPDVSFNDTATEMGLTGGALDTNYSERIYKWAGIYGWENDGLITSPSRQVYDAAKRGQWDVNFRNFSVPIYDAADADTTIHMYQSGEGLSLGLPWERPAVYGKVTAGVNGVRTGDAIPWNNAWTAPPGSDGIIIIVDYETGHAWDFFRANLPISACVGFPNAFNDDGNGNPGFLGGRVPAVNPILDTNNSTHRCASSATYYDNIFTDPGTVSSRGAGFPKPATIVRADEVEAGVIKHPLEMTVFNQMWGSACAGGATNLSASGAGTTCAVYQPPGSKIEHATRFANNACGNDQPDDVGQSTAVRSKTVPSGMRFRLNITDAEITTWLDSRSYTGQKRRTARIFAVALRDYGWIVAETGCANRPSIETDGFVNASTKAKWLALGLTDSGYDGDSDGKADTPSSDLLYGLVTQARVQLVNAG
jgi:hypothetical protein